MAIELWKLPVPATSLLKDPSFVVLPKRQCELQLHIEGSEGEAKEIRLGFDGVEAYKCTYLTSCSPEMFNVAYGKLIRLGATSWLTEAVENYEKASRVTRKHGNPENTGYSAKPLHRNERSIHGRGARTERLCRQGSGRLEHHGKGMRATRAATAGHLVQGASPQHSPREARRETRIADVELERQIAEQEALIRGMTKRGYAKPSHRRPPSPRLKYRAIAGARCVDAFPTFGRLFTPS